MKKINNLIVALTLVILASCAPYYYPIEQGKIATSGVEIKAEDGSFTLKSGDFWQVPFSVKPWMKSNLIGTESYSYALSLHGAKKVKVKIQGEKEEFFGVLLLCNKYKDCSGPASRSYQISIPNSRIEQAKGGKISLVYEYDNSCISTNKSPGNITWALWLSDMPFQTTPSKGGPLRAR